MKFYNSIGPNPRVVKMFMKEKGIEIPFEEIDLMKGDNRREPYLSQNPSGQMPSLELDNGAFIAEITAICEYLDEKFPGTSLVGSTPEERAETRMWTRRADLKVCEPLANGFRFSQGLGLFKDRMRCLPEAADGLKAVAQDGLAWFDQQLAGREFLAGKRMTLADILLFCFLDFGAAVGQPLNPELKNLGAWYERMKARPSAAATA
jgi:glutathione S-transferase